MEPISIGAILAGISGAFRLADYAIRIAEAGSASEPFVRAVQIVQNDLEEAKRLLSLQPIQEKLLTTHAKLSWIEETIESARTALYEIGKWVGRPKNDKETTGSIRFQTRVRWAFYDHNKILNHQTELFTCHQQLSNILAYLEPLEDATISPDPPYYEDVAFFDDLVFPRQRRRQRTMQAPVQKHQLHGADNGKTNAPYTKTQPPSNSGADNNSPAISSFKIGSIRVPEGHIPATSNTSTDLAIMKTPPGSDTPQVTSGRIKGPSGPQKFKEMFEFLDSQYTNSPSRDKKEEFALSGTNNSGPVDPLGLLPITPHHQDSAQKKTKSHYSIYESPCAMDSAGLFNDDEPPPRYPGSRYPGHRLRSSLSLLDLSPSETLSTNPFRRPRRTSNSALLQEAMEKLTIDTPASPTPSPRGVEAPSKEARKASTMPKKATVISTRRRSQRTYIEILESMEGS